MSPVDGSRPDEPLTVGALAQATGVTVRALRHYDQLGLLTPARDRAGRRRYGPPEVRRLHHIIALRSFGLPLGEITQLLDGTGADPRDLLLRQLRRTEEQLAALEQLRGTLLRIVEAWPPGGVAEPPASQLMELIERTTAMTQKLTMEQFEQLARQRAEAVATLSPEQLATLQRQREEHADGSAPRNSPPYTNTAGRCSRNPCARSDARAARRRAAWSRSVVAQRWHCRPKGGSDQRGIQAATAD